MDAFAVADLRGMALARVKGADAAVLVPLSTLASLPDLAPRSDVTPAMEALARQHGWPSRLGSHEWQVWTLRATLENLQDAPMWFEDEDWAAAIADLELLRRRYSLQKVWTALGLDDGGPPLTPPHRATAYATTLGELDAPAGELLEDALTVIHAWIAGQETLLTTDARLWAAGYTADAHVVAAAVERASEDMRGHLAHERPARAEAERRLGAVRSQEPRRGWSLFRRGSS